MAQTKRPMKLTGGAILVLLVALGMFAISIYLTIREYQLGTNGVSAVGTVTKYEKRGRSVYWTITYQHQGQQVSATVEPSMFSGLELGKEVPILYDPKDPMMINVDRFLHRYFYQTLGFGLGVLCLSVLPLLLWQSDEAWLMEYATKLSAGSQDQSESQVAELVLGFWRFDLSSGSSPRGAIAGYFRTHGLSSWSVLKDAWDPDAVPSLEPVFSEIDRIIADGDDPVKALTKASPGIEKFYYPHRAAILKELRDYATDPQQRPNR